MQAFKLIVGLVHFESLSLKPISLFLLTLLLPFVGFSQSIELSSSRPYLRVTEGSFLIDSFGELSFQELLSDSTQILTKFNSENKGFKKSEKTYWIKSQLYNSDDFDNEWILDFQGWSRVNFHYKIDSINWEEKITGHRIPYNNRDHPIGNRSLIIIPIKAQSTIPFYVRLESVPDNMLVPRNLHYSVNLRNQLESDAHLDELIVSTFIGICIALFLYNLFIYLITRELSTLFYLGHVLCLSYVIANNSGYLIPAFQFFENFLVWRAPLEAITSGLNFLFICFFTMYFLHTAKYIPVWHKALKVIMIEVVLLVFAAIFSYDLFGSIIWLVTYFNIFFIVSLAIVSMIKKVPSSGYYMLAYGFTFLGITIVISGFLGVVPINNIFVKYSNLGGYGLEIIFFSFAIGNKINILQNQSKEQQKVIIKSMKEKEVMQEKTARELEKKVKERTQEINEQKRIVELEREKSQNLVLNILPKSAVDELINTGKYKPRHHQSVTVLFADFQGFTNTVSTIPPNLLVSELNDLFRHFDDVMVNCNLEKIKTIGDAYMAACGLSGNENDHAIQCVVAAKQILEYLQVRNLKSAIKWEIRIGLHSGSVVAGIVGKNKYTYDLWGDTVNIANRMESACEVGNINVSAYTYDLVQSKFQGNYRGKINIKGKGEIDMYYV